MHFMFIIAKDQVQPNYFSKIIQLDWRYLMHPEQLYFLFYYNIFFTSDFSDNYLELHTANK